MIKRLLTKDTGFSKKAGIVFILLFFGAVTLLSAQVRTITGKVSDSKESLPGATVIVKGTTRGTTADMDGKFTLQVLPGDAALVFSFVGYEAKEVPIGSENVIEVILEQQKTMLSELVVIGYGTVRKSDLTGSVSSVKAKELTKITSLNPEQNLQGKVAGVQVTSTTGAPGTAPSVRIRGVGTFNNSSPIYVVDGIILDDISFLNSADIASMEVLKDASATAIYGSRGANGVIMVTTKSGKAGDMKTSFSYNGEYSIQKLIKKVDLLDGKEFATIANEIRPGTYNNLDALPNTDWQSLVFRSAPIQNHQFSASGSTAKTQYYVGVGYYNQKGIIDKSSYERITLKFNNTYNLTDHIKLGNNITITPFKQQNAPDATFQVYRAWPTLEPYRADGSFAGVPGVGNPLADIANSNSYNKGIRAVGNMFVEATILKNFTVKSSFGVDGLYNNSYSYTPVYAILYYDGTASMQNNPKSRLFKGNSTNLTWLWENTINYNAVFGKHSINAVAGYTMQNSSSEILNVTGENILRDGTDFWYLQPNNITANTISSFENKVDENLFYSMISYLFRANYTYNSKYILTATFRRDGSSKFYTTNRWGNFPSVALGWNASREEFMKNIPAISNLKVRASWGQIGNEKIEYLQRFSVTENLLAVFGPGDIAYPGVSYAKSGNPDLKWETTSQTDAGIEIGLFNGKLSGEFDFYSKTTSDILIPLSTPGHMGNGQDQKVTYNAAKVLNRGLEASLTWKDKLGELGYSINMMASSIHNEVLNIGGNSGVDSLLYGANFNGFMTQSREGLPIGAFYGYKIAGVFQNQAELDAYPHTSDAGIGDLRRVDVNKDGKISGLDRTYIGSPIPTFIFGLNIELEYKNFDFSFNIQGQNGNKIYNAKETIRPDAYNFEQHVMGRWTGEGTSNTEPKASYGGYNFIPSDKYVQDGSFARLRSVVLGYTLPESVTKKLKSNQLRVYVKGSNLYTLAKFTGYTPEIGSGNVLENSIDRGVYPISAIYSIGVNLTF